MAERSAKQLGLNKSQLPNSIVDVVSALNRSGFDAYIVGGGVRDSLLGLNPKDFDAVTDAKPHEVKDVFGKRCRIIGRRFQLAHVYSGRDLIEVATFRAPPKDDGNTTEEGMLIRDNVWGDIKQDFARRDFSINALYYQPIKNIVHDFCNALDDIESKTLRLLGHAPVRIEEDPVRLLRALRFKAKLDFDFDTELSEQFHDNNWALLEQVSPHRLYDETQKMFTGGYLVPLLPLLFEYGAIRHLIIYPPESASALVTQVAVNTDKRIASGKSINPAFFYAALLWDNYLYQLNKFKKRNMPFGEAQQQAASKVIERQRIKTAIPKFAEQFIRDIWILQPKLANPRVKQITQLAEQPRFRAAFDFLLLREQCNDELNPLSESTNGMGAWWQHFQTLSDKEKQQAIDSFGKDVRRAGGQRRRQRNSQDDSNIENSGQVSGGQESNAQKGSAQKDSAQKGDNSQNTQSTANPQPNHNKNRANNSQNHTHNNTQKGKNNIQNHTDTSPSQQDKKERAQLQQLSLADQGSTHKSKQPSPLFTHPDAPSVKGSSSQDSAASAPASSKPSKAKTTPKAQKPPRKSAKDQKAATTPKHTQPPETPGVAGKSSAVPDKRRRREPSSTLSVIEREQAAWT